MRNAGIIFHGLVFSIPNCGNNFFISLVLDKAKLLLACQVYSLEAQLKHIREHFIVDIRIGTRTICKESFVSKTSDSTVVYNFLYAFTKDSFGISSHEEAAQYPILFIYTNFKCWITSIASCIPSIKNCRNHFRKYLLMFSITL